MQTNKNLIFISIFLLIIGCKKNEVKAQVDVLKDTAQKTEKIIPSKSAKPINKWDKSFVVSCGSGCAMTYIVDNISQNLPIIKVKFKVEMYTDEKLSDTYDETYTFSYDKSNKIETIQLEGDNENVLETLIPDAQESFRNFAIDLSKNSSSITNSKKENFISNDNEHNYVKLPFNFEDYYQICYGGGEKCKSEYPSYNSPAIDNILSFYQIKEEPSKIFFLPPINNLQPLILAYNDSDTEGYYLYIAKKGLVISSLLIGKMDGESIQDFSISKEYNIILYTRAHANDSGKIIGKYKILNEGKIRKIK